MTSRRHAITAALATFLTRASWAQTTDNAGFPNRPVRLIVPFPPGGTTDILARDVAQQLSTRWGVNVIVDNKAGASGTIGSQELVRSAPDGHTLMITATHHVINPGLMKKLPYDTRQDFTPLAQVAAVANVLVVNPSINARSVQELIAQAKANPGSLSFASTGIGGANHLAGELFNALAGIKMVHIPYKGAAPALNDVVAGQVPVMFDSVPGVLPQIQAGKLRALAVTTLTRTPSLPDVPTIDESGVRGFDATAWFGLYGPANLRPAVMRKIVEDVTATLQSAPIREQFSRFAAEVTPMTQPEFAKFVDREIDKWAKVIDQANIKID